LKPEALEKEYPAIFGTHTSREILPAFLGMLIKAALEAPPPSPLQPTRGTIVLQSPPGVMHGTLT